jgi:hypothetical protein
VNALGSVFISDPEPLILPLHLKNLDVSAQVLAIPVPNIEIIFVF